MILIIGCAGYIASHLAKEFLLSGVKVRGLALSEDEQAVQKLVEDGLEFYAGDIRKKYDLERAMDGVDIVYNLAGLHSTIDRMREIYVTGTKNLLELCYKYGTEKVILASSGAVYGDCDDEVITEEHIWDHRHPFSDITCEMEKIARYFFLQKHIGVIILRIAEVYGSGKFNFFHKKITDQTQVAGKPGTYNSRIFIEDLVQILKMAPSELAVGEAYNVSDNCAGTLQEFYEDMGTAMPKWMDITSAPDRIQRSIHGLRAHSVRMSNQKLMNRLSYSLKLPTYKEGIEYCRLQIRSES